MSNGNIAQLLDVERSSINSFDRWLRKRRLTRILDRWLRSFCMTRLRPKFARMLPYPTVRTECRLTDLVAVTSKWQEIVAWAKDWGLQKGEVKRMTQTEC